MADIRAHLQRQNEEAQARCPHSQITAQVMFNGRKEIRCHRCLKLIEPGPDEALIPALVAGEDDPDTPGTRWNTLGYKLVPRGKVDVQDRMKFMGGGFVAQVVTPGGAHFSARGATREAALEGLAAAVTGAARSGPGSPPPELR